MWFENDFVGGEREERRRRVKLICRCREVRREREREEREREEREREERERFICRCRRIRHEHEDCDW
ncbi:hypothetical protein MHB50_03480 [Siminovitchia sp. FSL H7-0308]|uniref:Uncharacterized protein n=1 Tax=Siminovitchia thermophila TaxID=1245522 RepID=A0ABS2RDC7_9BACI|nr:hypothetical protein [Siminovitchia thermophila]MBM7717584.1 hypothetical protein [Siminovitchia thermophila]